MRLLKWLAPVVAATMVAVAIASAAAAGSQHDRATGGGQIFTSTPGTGPGDTIAFTAQDTGGPGNASKGEIQYVPHTAANSAPSHGNVLCLVVNDSNTAFMEGLWTSGQFAGDEFDLTVTDNGQGSKATGDDMIVFTPNEGNDGGNDCDGPTGASYALARGNVQVYDAP